MRRGRVWLREGKRSYETGQDVRVAQNMDARDV